MDYVNYSGIGSNKSYGSYPDGSWTNRQIFHYPTPGYANNPASDLPPVRINEWMAVNDVAALDPSDLKSEDWFELYNGSNGAVDLSGFMVGDGSTNRWSIPAGVWIPGYGFKLAWCHSRHKAGQLGTDGSLHPDFGLDAGSGDSIRLLAPDGSVVDEVVFGPQLTDVGEGRWPDGEGRIYQMPIFTPWATNRLFRVVTLQASNDTVRLEWSTRTGQPYRVYWSDSMTNGVWTALPDLTASSGMLWTNLTGAGSWTNRFFKIRQVQ